MVGMGRASPAAWRVTAPGRAARAAVALGALLGVGAAGCSFDLSALKLGSPPGDAASEAATDAGAPSDGGSPDAVRDGRPRDGARDAPADAADAGGPEAAPADATPAPDGPTCSGPDSDGDGIPDACDPCAYDGPNASIALPVSTTEISITAIRINNGGNRAVLAPGVAFDLEVDFTFSDCTCPTCYDIVELGFVPGSGVSVCVMVGVAGCSTQARTAFATPPAPTVPGQYDLRFGLRRETTCAADWWQGTPPAARTVGGVCVF